MEKYSKPDYSDNFIEFKNMKKMVKGPANRKIVRRQ
tara:strand:- start:953 stop:1060 length:108 start_codon:yes stop_codon:yes gene_type:complete